ncbi:MAG: transcriptional repressor LexA [Myxococcota bacterium]
MALTRRQHEIYEFVSEFVAEHGYSPSLEEIGERFGLSSVATVHKHVQHLVSKGYLRKSWNRSRSLEPVRGRREATVPLPLLGSVAAGVPIEAIEVRETLDVPRGLVPARGNAYVLRVSGDSMIEDQIRDGDLVVIEQREEARDGETVVALVRGEDVTLKKLRRKGNRVRLIPANSALQPIEVPAADVRIQGVVHALIRRY